MTGPTASAPWSDEARGTGEAVRLAALAATAAATLLAALWVREPRVSYLVGVLVATATAVGVAWPRRTPRRWTLLFAVTVVAFAAPASWTQRAVAGVDARWDETQSARARDGAATIARAVGDAATGLADAAARALDAPDSGSAAFDALEAGLPRGAGERSLVILRDEWPVAWTGIARVPIDSLRAPVGVARTTFYVVLYATATRGARRAVATEVLQAAPPADRVARTLDATLAASTGGWRFHLAEPGAAVDDSWQVVAVRGRPVVAVRAEAPPREQVRARIVERGRAQAAPGLAVMVLVAVAAAWYRARMAPRHLLARRLASLLVPLAAIAIVPLSGLSNATRLFDPSVYFATHGGAFTASIGALALTCTVLLLALFAVLRSGRPLASRWVSTLVVLAVSAVTPFVLRDLARGIRPPSLGVSIKLWIAWQVALFLAAAAILITGATAGRVALGGARGIPPLVAPVLGALAAFAGPILWHAPSGWPRWYPFVWCAAVGALALTRRTRTIVVAASAVAGLGAATLVWGAVANKRVELAVDDVRGLTTPGRTTEQLLERMARALGQHTPRTRGELLAAYAASPLAFADLPVHMASWAPATAADPVATATVATATVATATVATEAVSVDSAGLRALVATVRQSGEAAVAALPGTPGVAAVLAVPHDSGRITTVAAFSRTRSLPESPVAPLLGLRAAASGEPPYTLSVLPRVSRDEPAAAAAAPTWSRAGNEIHGDWVVATLGGRSRAHIEVELRPLDVLAQRGALLVLLDMLVIGMLWAVPAAADGTLARRARIWRVAWARSYRGRLTVALFTFFVVPAAAFAVWSYRQLQSTDVQGRALLVRETLRAAAADVPNRDSLGLVTLGQRLGTPLLVFEGGVLRRSSEPLFFDLAPVGLLLPKREALDVAFGEEVASTRELRIGKIDALFGYHAAVGAAAQRLVVAAPARTDDVALDQRRRDLGFLVLLIGAGGALAALWLSGLAANELARPVGALREAALAIARGEREPVLAVEPPTEFRPVFMAFRRMATDLSESRSALEAAQRRTAAVLRNVASGVLAVRGDRVVTIANPRAEQLLGATLAPGAPLAEVCPAPLAERVVAFIDAGRVDAPDEEEFDLELHGRQLRGRLTRLERLVAGDEGTVVLTLDDLTELARAQRVLAWGEMARQVAHEIKNPLTPIRLGMQHVRRAYFDRRGNFDEILERNVERVLAEIDRLDEIARAFSRYGTAPAQRPPGVPTDVAAVARDVVALERLGQSGVAWEVTGADAPALALAREDELREVLLNVLENARHANATTVSVSVATDDGVVSLRVTDDGEGIPDDVQSRVFEPHFSTRTSGSGLGLAISRRLIEGWGGTIALRSRRGVGTTVTLTLRQAAADAVAQDAAQAVTPT